jgi:hypothetical protein
MGLSSIFTGTILKASPTSVMSSFLRGEPEASAKTASSLGITPFNFVIAFLSDSNRDSITDRFCETGGSFGDL